MELMIPVGSSCAFRDWTPIRVALKKGKRNGSGHPLPPESRPDIFQQLRISLTTNHSGTTP